jgi:hypothetical protein
MRRQMTSSGCGAHCPERARRTGRSRLTGQSEQVLAEQAKRPQPDERRANDGRAESTVDAMPHPRDPAAASVLDLQRQAETVDFRCELAYLLPRHRWSPTFESNRDARTAALHAERPTIDLYVKIGLKVEASPGQLLGSVVLIVTAP